MSDAPGRDDEADAIVFDALWSGVVNGFETDQRHAKFLDHAHRTGRLLDAARRYGALKDDPERGEGAKKRLAAITLLATHEMLSTKTHARKRPPAWLYVLTVLVCGGLLAWVAIVAWRGGR